VAPPGVIVPVKSEKTSWSVNVMLPLYDDRGSSRMA